MTTLERVKEVYTQHFEKQRELEMLILNRRPGESVVIRHPAGDVVVTVLSTINDDTRLGFDAPRDIDILRSEIVDRYPEGG